VSGLLRVLAEHDVEFMVVGGVCAVSAPDVSRLCGPRHNLFMTSSGPLDVLGTIGRDRDFSALRSRGKKIWQRFRSSSGPWRSDGSVKDDGYAPFP
jgi:hypothetical protein